MYYIGIDIAKRSHVAAVQDAEGAVVIPAFKFSNTQTGFEEFLQRLKDKDVNPDECKVGMEATGHYWICLFDFLSANGYSCAVINPIQTDAFRKVESVRVTKTDAIDAVLIADLLRFKNFAESKMKDEPNEELKNLARYRSFLVSESTAVKNKAMAVLDRIFPEFANLFADKYCGAAIALLKEYATPASIAKTDIRTLTKIIKEGSRGRLGREKAEQIKAAAKVSIGASLAAEGLAFQLRLVLENLDFVRGQIGTIDTRLKELLEVTQGKYLLTIPGIDVALASLIAGEIGDANRFEKPKKLIAYAGMDATKKQSGESDNDGHMSKRGSAQLRYALMLAAKTCAQADPYFGDYCSNKMAEGNHYYIALSGVARKLAGVILSLMKEQRPYEPMPPKHHQGGHLNS